MAWVECRRCGLRWSSNTSARDGQLCSSCRATRAKTVRGAFGKCFPWQGDFAEDDLTPVDDFGVPVLPGLRKCGKQDCVNVEHIERGS